MVELGLQDILLDLVGAVQDLHGVGKVVRHLRLCWLGHL